MRSDTVRRLSTLFRAAYDSEHSSFYRDRYANTAIRPDTFPAHIEEWRSLPFLSKEDIMATPFGERLFVPFAQAHSVRMSSGTSGRGVVLIPRNFHVDRSYCKDKFTRMLSFYVPHFGIDEACEPLGLGHIGAVPDDVDATVRMAVLGKVDALAGACSPILAFTRVFEPVYDCSRIRYIHLWGERPSAVQFQELADAYPHAELTWEYSNIEASGQGGRPCEALAALRDDRVHPLHDRYYWELIDAEGIVIEEPGVEGEIVLTTLWPGNAFPVIRYRTGDLALHVESSCACDSETFQILGRVAYDRAVIPGGELKSEELERVLEPFRHEIEANFELHVTDASSELPSLTLYIEERIHGVSFARIQAHVSATLRIGATRTLKDAEDEGLIRPLLVAPLSRSGKKVRRIVRS